MKTLRILLLLALFIVSPGYSSDRTSDRYVDVGGLVAGCAAPSLLLKEKHYTGAQIAWIEKIFGFLSLYERGTEQEEEMKALIASDAFKSWAGPELTRLLIDHIKTRENYKNNSDSLKRSGNYSIWTLVDNESTALREYMYKRFNIMEVPSNVDCN